jgi:hypothetical protein
MNASNNIKSRNAQSNRSSKLKMDIVEIQKNQKKPPHTSKPLPVGLIHEQQFFKPAEYAKWTDWLTSLYPIWESRYLSSEISTESKLNDNQSTSGQPNSIEQRQLLRPVYWMGNWQFACLGYFQLPNGTQNRCVTAELFPDFVQHKINLIEEHIRNKLPPAFIPKKWRLNTLLINYYGSLIENDKKVDQARLGEHKDHEPGPVASISFGAKSLFQFVSSAHRQASSQVIFQQWLEDNSFFAFAGDKFKNRLFHRVQRVDRKSPVVLNCKIPQYETRRINLTFRYVPEEFNVDYKNLPQNLKSEIDPYINELAKHSSFFAKLKAEN